MEKKNQIKRVLKCSENPFLSHLKVQKQEHAIY